MHHGKDETAHLLFTVAGRVQGVFFRKHTKRAADALGLEGWIVNDPCARKSDSSVSGEAIGPVDSIRQFSRFLSEQGSPKCVIRSHTFAERTLEDYAANGGHEDGSSGVCGSGGSGGGREEEKLEANAAGTKKMKKKKKKNTKMENATYEPRGFVVARHPRHGYLVLFATKKTKGLHGQLPGGRVDADELDAYGSGVASAVVAAARELFEETGIDVRRDLGRLRHVGFPGAVGGECAGTALKGRYFFTLELVDSDSASRGTEGKERDTRTEPGCVPFAVRLSREHVEWVFEEDEERVASMIDLHSGGKVRAGFLVATAIVAAAGAGVGAGVGAGAGAKDTVGAGGTNDGGTNEAMAVWNRVRSSIRRRGEMRGMARLERGHIPPFFIVK